MALTNPYEDSPRPHQSTIDEERKGMLHDFDSIDLPRVEESTHANSKSRRYILPLSLASNLLLFVVILFQLAHPCFLSARTCVYDKRGLSQETVMEVPGSQGEVMGDVNQIVPECTIPLHTNRRMLADKQKKYSPNTKSRIHERLPLLERKHVQKRKRIQHNPNSVGKRYAP